MAVPGRLLLALVCVAVTAVAQAQQWDHYGGSQAGLHYSAASQINRSNVGQLKEAWRFRTGGHSRLGTNTGDWVMAFSLGD